MARERGPLKVRTAVAFVVGACLSTSACGATAEARRELPAVGPLPQVRSITDVVTPLNAYLQTGEQLRRQEEATNLLLDECTRRYGQPYVPAAAESNSTPALSPYRFNVVDVRTASQFGYHDPDNELSFGFSVKHPVVIPKGQPTSKVILDGPSKGAQNIPVDTAGKPVPPGGCRGVVDRELGTTPSFEGKIADYLEAIDAEIRDDPRVATTIKDWAACMKEAGYNYKNPLEPVRQYGAQSTMSPEEQNTAEVDATCKQKTNYIGRRLQIESAYDRQSLDQNSATWNGYRQWIELRNKRVAEVLANRGR